MSIWTIHNSEPPSISTTSIPHRANTFFKPLSTHFSQSIPLSIIEQNGLHATLIVRIALNGSLDMSRVIFPTSIMSPYDPRGYLSAPLTLSSSLNGSRNIEYDGITISFTAEGRSSLSLFVSPTHPTVWAFLNFDEEQVSPDIVGVHKRTHIHDTSNLLWKDECWFSTTQLQIAHTKLDEGCLPDLHVELAERRRLVRLWTHPITLWCPVTEVSVLHHFAKIRTQESVCDAPTLGRVHSPGGGMFYCGVWCNDQAEYAAPVLAMLGGDGSQARSVAVHSLFALARSFNIEEQTMPYSVEIDGGYIGRLDRGDAGMYAWGASLTLITIGDPHTTDALFPYIKFTCAIILAKIKSDSNGIVPSQSDELEGRFPSGSANFSVNCISILAFQAAAEAAVEAGEPELSNLYSESSVRLRENVDQYFSVSGPEAYTYFQGCNDARGWTCLAALAGLPRGREAVKYVLNEMWSEDGILTSSSAEDIWDRCTLYGIRAAFQAGLGELASERLATFATKRTTYQPAAPFAFENNSSYAQLSAESALMIRVVTEGLLGISVRHGGCFIMKPVCPSSWPAYSVNSVFIAQKSFDFRVTTTNRTETAELLVSVRCGDKSSQEAINNGTKLLVHPSADSFLISRH